MFMHNTFNKIIKYENRIKKEGRNSMNASSNTEPSPRSPAGHQTGQFTGKQIFV
jgi:hypothetical protein